MAQAAPTTNFGSGTTPCPAGYLISGNDSTFCAAAYRGYFVPYLRFDLSAIPAGATINSATLTLPRQSLTGSFTASLDRVTSSWTETGITFNSQPTATALTTFAAGSGSPGTKTFDVTTTVRAWQQSPSTNHGFRITSSPVPPAGNAELAYARERGGPFVPSLTVDYSGGGGTSLAVTVQNQDGTARPGAKVVRYLSGVLVDTRDTDGNGQTPPYTDLTVGSQYFFEAYYEGANAFDAVGELWTNATLTVQSGSNTLTLRRNWPYVESLRFFAGSVELTSASTITAGTQVRVEAAVRNKLPTAQNVRVQVRLDRNQASSWDFDQLIGPTLVAGGNSTAVFTTTYTPAAAGSFSAAVKTETDSGVGWAKTDAWAFFQTFTVSGVADLVVDNVSPTPNTVNPGGSTSVAFVIRNQGTAAAGLFANEIRLKGPGGSLVSTQNRNLGGLAAGATSGTLTETVTIPVGAALGSYTIEVAADTSLTVVESNDSNNVRSEALSVVGVPDLVVADARLSKRLTNPGRTTNLSATFRNAGPGPAAPSQAKVRIKDAEGVVVWSHTFAVPGLLAGGTHGSLVPVTAPTDEAAYTIDVEANHDRAVTETNYENNLRSQLPLTVSRPGLTVLVHGYNFFNGETALSIWGDTAVRQLRDAMGGATVREWNWRTRMLEPIGLDDGPEVILLFNWVDASNDWSGGHAEAAADVLVSVLVENGWLDSATLPIQFIGHSRGAVVTSEAVQRLGLLGTSVQKVTFLDPHDWDQEPPEPFVPFDDHFHDPPPQVWQNAVYVENYWQQAVGCNLDVNPWGRSLSSIQDPWNNLDLTTKPGFDEARPHSNVPAWYWGTIDLADPVIADAGLCETDTGDRRPTWYLDGGRGEGFDWWVQRGAYNARPVNEPSRVALDGTPLRYPVERTEYEALPPDIFNGNFNHAESDSRSPAGWSRIGGGVEYDSADPQFFSPVLFTDTDGLGTDARVPGEDVDRVLQLGVVGGAVGIAHNPMLVHPDLRGITFTYEVMTPATGEFLRVLFEDTALATGGGQSAFHLGGVLPGPVHVELDASVLPRWSTGRLRLIVTKDPNGTSAGTAIHSVVAIDDIRGLREPIGALADLSLTMTDAPDPVSGLGTVTYTFTVTNDGPSAATAVNLVHTLAPATAFVSSMGDGWSCGATSTVSCTRPSLAAGTTSPPLYVAAATGPGGGTLASSATVNSAVADPDMSNNSASAQTTVSGVPSADLSITIDDAGVTALWGRPVTFTVAVHNAGPDAVTGATVAASFPGGIGSVVWSCNASSGSSCTAAGNGNISDTAVTLLAGGTVTYSVTGIVVRGTVGPLVSTATVNAGTYDPAPANNSSDVSTPVNALLIFGNGFESP